MGIKGSASDGVIRGDLSEKAPDELRLK